MTRNNISVEDKLIEAAQQALENSILEIQVLFYGALQAARALLDPDQGGDTHIQAVNNRLSHLTYHVREYY